MPIRLSAGGALIPERRFCDIVGGDEGSAGAAGGAASVPGGAATRTGMSSLAQAARPSIESRASASRKFGLLNEIFAPNFNEVDKQCGAE